MKHNSDNNSFRYFEYIPGMDAWAGENVPVLPRRSNVEGATQLPFGHLIRLPPSLRWAARK
jgi:hypothetical protein